MEHGEMQNIQDEIQREILAELDKDRALTDEEIWEEIQRRVLRLGQKRYLPMEEKQQLIQQIFNSLRKLDVLQEILEDPEITEIMVNGSEHIFVEKEGKIVPYPKKFSSAGKLEDVIQQIVSKMNRVVNEASPIVDVRLEDGSRVNVVLPPVAINGPIMTVRKFPASPLTMEKLVQMQSITREAADFLKVLVQSGYNIFISGGTGSGENDFSQCSFGVYPGR